MILASAPNVPESYLNCSIIMEKVNINSVVYTFTGDLKIYNIVGGLMSCSSLCPCIYCESSRVDGVWEEDGELRTFRNIQDNLDGWKTAGGVRKKAKYFSNCVEKPLLYSEEDNPDTPMLLKVAPPALHLKLSINHFLSELAKVWPEVLDWLDSLNITLEPSTGDRHWREMRHPRFSGT